jgi:hypothetical protein
MEKLRRSRLKSPELPDNLVSRDVLVAAFEQLKMHYETLSVLMAEVAALRETLLKENGFQFAKELRKRETAKFEKSAPLEAELLVAYEKMIRRIKEM